MANVIQLELVLDEKGAVRGVRNIEVELQKMKSAAVATGTDGAASFDKMDASAKRLGASVASIGDGAGASAAKESTAHNSAGDAIAKHEKKIISAKDAVKIFGQETGIHVPLALKKLMISSESAAAAIQAMTGAMMAIAGIEFATMIVKQLDEIYHKYLDISTAAKAFNKEIADQAKANYSKPESIETTRERRNDAMRKAAEAHAEAADMTGDMHISGKKTLFALYYRYQAKKKEDEAVEYDRQARELADLEHKQAYELRKTAVENSGLPEKERTAKLARMKAAENNYQDRKNGLIASDSGKATEAADIKTAQKRSGGSGGVDVDKQRYEETRRLQEAVQQAGLNGIAKIEAQRLNQLRTFTEKFGPADSARNRDAIEAINTKAEIDKKADLERQHAETLQQQLEAKMAGMTGAGRRQAMDDKQVQDITALAQKGEITNEERDARIAAVHLKTLNEMTQDEKDFRERIDGMAEASADSQLRGYARIAADAKRELEKLNKDYRASIDGLAANDPLYKKYTELLHRGEAAIQQGAQGKAGEADQRNADETWKLEEQARIRSLSGERQKTAQIQFEYDERVLQLKRSLEASEILQNDYDQRAAAAAQEFNAQMAELAKQQRDELAGQLESLMDNPARAMQNIGRKMMAHSAATLLQRMGVNPTDKEGGIIGSLGSSLEHFRNPFKRGDSKEQQPDGFHLPAIAHNGAQAARSALAITSASISIGSASISGLGVPGALQSGNASPLGVGGSLPNAPLTQGSIGGPGATGSSAPGVGASSGGSAIVSGVGGSVAGTIGSITSTTAAAKKIAGEVGAGKESTALLSKFGLGSNATGGKSMLAGGGVKANLGGAASGAMGLFGAFSSTGGFGGALGGATSGAELGASFGGPIGAAIGAIAGGVMGVLGFGGRSQAEKYWNRQGKPRMLDDERNYEIGATDYLSAYADLESLQTEAQKSTAAMGPGGKSYFGDTIKPAIKQGETKLTRMAKAGRGTLTMSAAQFHTGYEVTDFGDLATSPTEGLVHAQIGEFMVKPDVAARNRSALQALNAGASMEQVAAGYRSSMQGSAGSSNSGNRTANLHFHSYDAKGARDLFYENAHHVRGALNASREIYSGEADA